MIVLKLEDENYEQARIMAMDTIQKLHISPDQALVHLQREGFKDKKGSDKLQFMMFLDILSIFFKDCIKGKTICTSQSWLNAMKSYDAKDCIAYLSACMEAKDKCEMCIRDRYYGLCFNFESHRLHCLCTRD